MSPTLACLSKNGNNVAVGRHVGDMSATFATKLFGMSCCHMLRAPPSWYIPSTATDTGLHATVNKTSASHVTTTAYVAAAAVMRFTTVVVIKLFVRCAAVNDLVMFTAKMSSTQGRST